jgi:integrase
MLGTASEIVASPGLVQSSVELSSSVPVGLGSFGEFFQASTLRKQMHVPEMGVVPGRVPAAALRDSAHDRDRVVPSETSLCGTGRLHPTLHKQQYEGAQAVLVFTSPEGSPLRHSNFSRRVWLPALTAVGLEGVHIHDLRHTGNQFSAEAGANLRELMERMGHDSTRAASIYLHSSPERQQAIASQVGRNARKALGNSKRSGTRTARGQSMREAGE